MWSNLDDKNVSPVAKFKTDWSRCTRYPDRLTESFYQNPAEHSTSKTTIGCRTDGSQHGSIGGYFVCHMVAQNAEVGEHGLHNNETSQMCLNLSRCWGLEWWRLLRLSLSLTKVAAAVAGGHDGWRTSRRTQFCSYWAVTDWSASTSQPHPAECVRQLETNFFLDTFGT